MTLEQEQRLRRMAAITFSRATLVLITELAALLKERDSLVDAVAHLKRDPRDKFVRVGAFHGGHDDTRYVTFEPWDAAQTRQGNGEPRPPYAVRIASGG